MKKSLYFFLLTFLLLTACGQSTPPLATATAAPALATSTPTLAPSDTPVPSSPTPAPSATLPLTATSLPTETSAPTETATPVPTATTALTETPTAIPTYVKLRGEVIVEQAVCHYGPGKPYLYKYGVYQGSNLEIIARDELSDYVEVQAIGGNNACWVKSTYLKIKGNLADLQPIPGDQVKLPMSPYYGPVTGVSARRDGNIVTVFWDEKVLRAGDSSEQTPYIVEAWVCKNGQLVFTPTGSYSPAVKITDEPGCSTPSHGRVTAAEKHGYTRFVEVPWPQQ